MWMINILHTRPPSADWGRRNVRNHKPVPQRSLSFFATPKNEVIETEVVMIHPNKHRLAWQNIGSARACPYQLSTTVVGLLGWLVCSYFITSLVGCLWSLLWQERYSSREYTIGISIIINNNIQHHQYHQYHYVIPNQRHESMGLILGQYRHGVLSHGICIWLDCLSETTIDDCHDILRSGVCIECNM